MARISPSDDKLARRVQSRPWIHFRQHSASVRKERCIRANWRSKLPSPMPELSQLSSIWALRALPVGEPMIRRQGGCRDIPAWIVLPGGADSRTQYRDGLGRTCHEYRIASDSVRPLCHNAGGCSQDWQGIPATA